ncbi:MAG: hypothetical protein KDA96_20205, partial [Planctomycetaceae bacterium]|nr:hypothetical protein [Planctomycetaceae bacterium]
DDNVTVRRKGSRVDRLTGTWKTAGGLMFVSDLANTFWITTPEGAAGGGYEWDGENAVVTSGLPSDAGEVFIAFVDNDSFTLAGQLWKRVK